MIDKTIRWPLQPFSAQCTVTPLGQVGFQLFEQFGGLESGRGQGQARKPRCRGRIAEGTLPVCR